MAKKILCVITLILALNCALASCSSVENTPEASNNSIHTHNYGEWETTKNATCTAEGTKERYCSCGEKQTTTIAKTEHEFGAWSVLKDSTFAEAGEKIRSCSCGKTETLIIPKKTPTETNLTKSQYIAELQEIFQNISEQKSLVFNDADIIYGRYFDGNEYVLYCNYDNYEEFYGKFGNEYLLFINDENSKICDHISYDEFAEFLEYMNEALFDDVWDGASLECDSDNEFECKKTVSDKTVYTVKGFNYSSRKFNVTVTVINDLITEILLDTVIEYQGQTRTDHEKITFEYDRIIEMPDKSEYCIH